MKLPSQTSDKGLVQARRRSLLTRSLLQVHNSHLPPDRLAPRPARLLHRWLPSGLDELRGEKGGNGGGVERVSAGRER